MINVDYKVLSDLIRRCCKQQHKHTPSMEFYVEYNKLVDLVADYNLLPVKIGTRSKKVIPDVIPFISEYYEKSNLAWYSEGKHIVELTFMDVTGLDDEARRIIADLNTPQIDIPDEDKVRDMAKLVADYPCYFALVTSYQNNDPRLKNRPSYTVSCRANKVVIKSSDYQYNPKDFS